MVLREQDIAVFMANWKPKEENLRAIAAAMNIGLDAMVFVDDNPAERVARAAEPAGSGGGRDARGPGAVRCRGEPAGAV